MANILKSVMVPPLVMEPRGAVWAAALWNETCRAALAVWRACERMGARRAEQALRQHASRVAHSDPELAGILRAVADANAVRELAHSYRETDPGFAQDLLAAALRHESAAEAAQAVAVVGQAAPAVQQAVAA